MSALYLLGFRDDERGTEEVTSSEGKTILSHKKGLGVQPADLIRLYDRRDHYVAVGRDADAIAAFYFRSSSAVRHWSDGDGRTPYLAINKKMAAEVMRACLLVQRRRLEVYSLDGARWVLSRRGSPGNISAFEEECLRDGELPPDASTTIAAVRLGRTAGSKGYSGNARLVGVCFADGASRSLRTSEFEDDENLCTLESLLCQQGTREVAVTDAPRGAFAQKHAEQDLRRLVGSEQPVHARAFETQQQLPVGCFSALCRHLDLPSLTESHGQWGIEWVEPREFVRLDASALRALSVEPQPNEADRNASLYGIFAKTKTAGGGRLLRKWLKQPLLSPHEIEHRLDLVQTFVSSLELRATLRDTCLPAMGARAGSSRLRRPAACARRRCGLCPLVGADLDRLQRRLFSGRATLQDVVLLYSLLGSLPRLLSALAGGGYAEGGEGEGEVDGHTLVQSAFTEPLQVVHENFERYRQLVHAAELAGLGASRDETVAEIEAAHEALCERLGVDEGRVKLEKGAPHGYHCRVSRKENMTHNSLVDEKLIRDADGVNVLGTKKDGVAFRDKALDKLAARYKELAAHYQTAQARPQRPLSRRRGARARLIPPAGTLVTKVVDTAATFCPLIAELAGHLTKLDVLLAFAAVAASAPEPYVRPTLLPPEAPRALRIDGARHPCVERMESAGGGTGSFIKNDVALGDHAADAEVPSLLLVTGPNCGGKSTYIRSVGVCVLLAQVGCFVPADAMEFSPVDAILARVGAGDMQSRGVSTFMAEMLEHFHELTALADREAAVGNRHVAAHVDGDDLTPLFKVQPGPSDQSYGVAVAASCDFPSSVVESAKRKLAELESATVGGGPAADAADATAKRERLASVTAEERAAGTAEVRRRLFDFGMDTPQLSESLRASTNPYVRALLEVATAEVAAEAGV
ncbi:DNA mismatch repair protein muts [Emiliania huxleyi CCMP1516]|uniref:DNA mismatch repair proteins mutS family domain-containing protein n=2 Tax=Emiliania huxleyi TaxID=2903 RepID=A0A0D3JEL4_EMIH1|nr:DNA mismatch repair protein muts [Emiliania huxleyi CCMP1516]EOD21949.1 DNA mismatch repair protein muts [Emiliania huxleyi CCMP1516]|eukprot:XP_005774378.1 DNA mismatch repair protein muts [Emiliania huxleyi CCMP1516]